MQVRVVSVVNFRPWGLPGRSNRKRTRTGAASSMITLFGNGSWLRENSEIEFANGNFVSTSINLKNKSAGEGCRDKTIEKTILCALRARTFSRSQGQKADVGDRLLNVSFHLSSGHKNRTLEGDLEVGG